MTRTTSELRLPADPAYIVVAKRAASAFAAVAGFDVEAVHDLTIAVAQACENALACAARAGGLGTGQIRLTFTVEGARLEVQVQSSCTRQALAAGGGRAGSGLVAEAVERERQEVAAATDLALRLMGLFVDDHSYRVDERTGGLRVRLTKYQGFVTSMPRDDGAARSGEYPDHPQAGAERAPRPRPPAPRASTARATTRRCATAWST